MNIRTPLGQAAFFLILSCIIGFGSNLVREDKIPWIAPELATTESLDVTDETHEPILAVISLVQAKQLFDDGILFVDARDDAYYSKGHIQGAMKNAFLMELIFNIEARQSKADPLVVYCGDPGCGDSEDLAYDLQDSGFTKLYVFKGGWLEWSKAGYPSEAGQ
ncbi:MAG: rhodanese-like domain-containing protein [Candidatus Marinimicrobia bacterium]|jgi:rhodanese-related sulfurtransferase|nr:rhodanese-like domain-containing protein [Candidatus Neomarinimicrobiota bacterium]MDP6612122.1 rhodanese-like domain-containing protein [Candidatus Neomarinimicrobiota bacterium]|tara:strand:- start:805 stop:1293 length:489 start_codon:yes stop_codon:yes gene_type:complete